MASAKSSSPPPLRGIPSWQKKKRISDAAIACLSIDERGTFPSKLGGNSAHRCLKVSLSERTYPPLLLLPLLIIEPKLLSGAPIFPSSFAIPPVILETYRVERSEHPFGWWFKKDAGGKVEVGKEGR